MYVRTYVRMCVCIYIYIHICVLYYIYIHTPVVPHKAVAEVSKPIGEVGCCESRTERWLELCFLEWLQRLQRSPHSQLLDVVWCSAVVVVVVVVVVLKLLKL